MTHTLEPTRINKFLFGTDPKYPDWMDMPDTKDQRQYSLTENAFNKAYPRGEGTGDYPHDYIGPDVDFPDVKVSWLKYSWYLLTCLRVWDNRVFNAYKQWKMEHCKHKNMTDESYGGPNSGYIGGHCPDCGFEYHSSLY